MDYTFCPDFNSLFWLMIAPPAWGKTYRLLELFRKRPDVLFIFVSPLRALANEFYDKISLEFNACLIEDHLSWKKFNKDHQILIVTPETFVGRNSILNQVKRPILYILDEFHLYSYWGTTFRESMWEALIEISLTEKPILAMTATYNKNDELFFKEQFQNQFELMIKMDHGNQKLLFPPSKVTYISSYFKKNIKEVVYFELKKRKPGTVLLFVQYRSQVQEYEKIFLKNEFKTLSCLGGEASLFSQKLKLIPRPDLIISTTVLSHGVNLPEISSVIFSYPVENVDFWIQMVGRGGRKGEKYSLYTLDQYQISCWSKLKSLIKLQWIVISLSFSLWKIFADED